MTYTKYSIIRSLIYRRLLWAGRVNKMEKAGNVYRILTGKSLEKRPRKDREDEESIQ
jgi:hypothetical protein